MTERSEDAQLRRDLLDALTTVQDPGQRIVLRLLHRGLEAINGKLDRVLNDEAKLKQIVLNGGAETHPDEHRWLREFKREWETLQPIVDTLRERHKSGDYCDYATRMMAEESDDKSSKRTIRDKLISDVLIAVLSMVAGALGAKYLGV